MNKIILAVLGLAVIGGTLYLYSYRQNMDEQVPAGGGGVTLNLVEQCQNADGEWLDEYNECQWMSGDEEELSRICSVEMGGEFDACASPCRNVGNIGACIASCDMVCSL